MWCPGFDFIESLPARLAGSHRALCVHSYHHRGTPERPGLVLGLAAGGTCCGLAFRVAGQNRDGVIDYLRAREQVTNVYLEKWRGIKLLRGAEENGRALCYVADPSHEQYAGQLSLEAQAACIRSNAGKSGENEEYVHQTVHRLRELGINDRQLEALAERLLSKAG